MTNIPLEDDLDVLLVEDDAGIGEFLQAALNREPGYNLYWETTLKDAWQTCEKRQIRGKQPFALILLDLGLPDGDGQRMIQKLRVHEGEQALIIIISARVSEADKIQALDSGADDYLTKPFTIGELLARLRAHLRRRPVDSSAECSHWVIGALELDDLAHTVCKNGVPISMTPKEYQLFHLFVMNQGRVLSYQRILSAVWGEHSSDQAHYVRLYIKRLREKIEDDPGMPQYLITEKGVGYRFGDILDPKP